MPQPTPTVRNVIMYILLNQIRLHYHPSCNPRHSEWRWRRWSEGLGTLELIAQSKSWCWCPKRFVRLIDKRRIFMFLWKSSNWSDSLKQQTFQPHHHVSDGGRTRVHDNVTLLRKWDSWNNHVSYPHVSSTLVETKPFNWIHSWMIPLKITWLGATHVSLQTQRPSKDLNKWLKHHRYGSVWGTDLHRPVPTSQRCLAELVWFSCPSTSHGCGSPPPHLPSHALMLSAPDSP